MVSVPCSFGSSNSCPVRNSMVIDLNDDVKGNMEDILNNMNTVAARLLSVHSMLSIRFEACGSSSCGNADDFIPRRTPNSSKPHLSFSKPSWIVQTESNVRKEQRKKPEPPCVVCYGTGRVDCHHCLGKGRTNFIDQVMLPKGEWPNWCKTCGGSGLGYCSRCLGTGEYRDIMGFHFMKTEPNQIGNHRKRPIQGNHSNLTAADLLLSLSSSDPDSMDPV